MFFALLKSSFSFLVVPSASLPLSARVQARLSPDPALNKCQDRIYLYDLPSSIDGFAVRDDALCEALESGSEAELDCLFGARLDAHGEVSGLELRNNFQFGLGRIYFARLRAHACRTMDPDEATLFFIPTFSANWPYRQYDCIEIENLLPSLTFLNWSTAHRHFMISPRVPEHRNVCPVFRAMENEHPLFARILKLALEDLASYDSTSGEHVHSVPYPAVTSGTVFAQRTQASTTKRTWLASAIFGKHGLGGAQELRHMLAEQCEASVRCKYIDPVLEDTPTSVEEHRFQPAVTTDVFVSDKLNATFCLEPVGDTTSRKGIVDSIVLGCIPVFFDMKQVALWPWHVRDWTEMSVLLSHDEPDFVARLEEIRAEEVQRMQTKLAEVAPRLAYSAPHEAPRLDALEIALTKLGEIARSST